MSYQDAETKAALDNFESFSRALGSAGKLDCTDQYKPHLQNLNGLTVEYAYLESFVIQRLCEFLPESALGTFKGWRVCGGEENRQLSKDLMKATRWFQRKIQRELLEACVLGRLTGDGYLILLLDDLDDWAKPIDWTRLSDVLGCLSVGAHDITFDSHTYETSSTAIISNQGVLPQLNPATTVHTSRIIRVPGKIIPKSLRDNFTGNTTAHYSNQSVLTTFLPAYQGWVDANAGIIQMLESHSAFALGLKGLAFKTKTKAEGELSGRFKMLLEGLKKLKAILYDADQEEASFINRSYSNIDKVIRSLDTYVASSVDIPLPYLFDGSEAYSSGSRAAREAMAVCVRQYQKSHLEPALDRLLWVWLHTCECNATECYDMVEYHWGDGLVLTREEIADLEFKHTQTDQLRLGGQPSISVDEARTRWRGGAYNDDLLVDSSVSLPAQENPAIPTGSHGATNNKTVNALTSENGRGAYTAQEVD